MSYVSADINRLRLYVIRSECRCSVVDSSVSGSFVTVTMPVWLVHSGNVLGSGIRLSTSSASAAHLSFSITMVKIITLSQQQVRRLSILFSFSSRMSELVQELESMSTQFCATVSLSVKMTRQMKECLKLATL